MAQVKANGEEYNSNGRGAAQQPEQQPDLVPNGAPNGAAAVALPDAAHVAAVVANPVIANLARALAPLGPIHPQFDVEAALLGPSPPTKSNRNFNILPIIK